MARSPGFMFPGFHTFDYFFSIFCIPSIPNLADFLLKIFLQLSVFLQEGNLQEWIQITHIKICKGQAFSGANWGDVSSDEGLGSRILSGKTSFPWVNPRMKTREYVTEPKTWVEHIMLTLGVASRKWTKEGRVGLGMEKDKELDKKWQ